MKQHGHDPRGDRDEDIQLAALLDEAHRGDAPPPFARLFVARPPGRRTRRRLAWASMAVAAAVALAIGLWPRSRSGPARPDFELARATSAPPDAAVAARIDEMAASLDRWRAPTDFLLDTPGKELLTETPRLDDTTFTLDLSHHKEEQKL